VAAMPEMRQGMPDDLWRAVLPLPAVPWPGARLHQGTALPARLDRADRIRKRLGDTSGSAFDGDDFPPKPKRMRWKTYRRLEEEYEHLRNRWTAGAMARFGIRL
jgi:hypothetical protein